MGQPFRIGCLDEALAISCATRSVGRHWRGDHRLGTGAIAQSAGKSGPWHRLTMAYTRRMRRSRQASVSRGEARGGDLVV